jgi:hypothetical protein
MTLPNELVLLIISGVGVILWFFVVNMIKELKEQGHQNNMLLLHLEKDMIELRFILKDYDGRLRRLEQESEH